MKTLSPKKQRFVDFIRSFTYNQNRPPTFVEIMDGLRIRSLGTINWYVNELEKEGILKRMKGHNGKRALSILEQHMDNSLPLLGLITAGYPLEVYEDKENIEVPPNFMHAGNYVLKVVGNSMIEDNIQDGDYVIIQRVQTAETGQTIVAYVNDEATLKRYYPKKNGIELHPRNPDYSIIHVSPYDDFKIGGIVLGLMRQYS
ncbi:MAG: repressor LexA [Candidatus Marinimicrobia bacterium]|nr:repressor LexA [Candidatus Neomarinimicrobiota bacterium]MBT4538475.1 repressor LexA [Candidatus Neomarinimicrobiota bacterium]MBT6713667.1 repressor LexA [Candidatus Neomarinimicrobiota bacterium]